MNNLEVFERKVFDTSKKYSMLEEGDSVLVGLSGGKDSAVLLCVLKKLSALINFKLCAFHLNHCIRGEEADRDMMFSERLSKKLDVPFYSLSVDVPSIAQKTGVGLEATAREVRYNAFFEFAKKASCNKIATAHTLSDNTETLFISLMRSSTLSPIPPVRGNIIRPLIECTTDEVVEYAKEANIGFVFDSSNRSTDYLRNFLRLSVLPALRSRSEGLDLTLLRAGKIHSSYRALAESEAEKYFKENPSPEKLSSLKTLASDESRRSVLFCVLSKLFEKENVVLTYERFEKVAELIKEGKTGKSISLSGDKRVVVGYETVYIESAKSVREDFIIPLKLGENPIPKSPFSVVIETPEEYSARKDKNKQKINKITKNILINSNIINTDFHARSRKTGDKFICRSINRSVKKFFIDEKIDKNLRDFFPIVCDNEGIVWVPGLGVADRVNNVKAEKNMSVCLVIHDKTKE